MYTVYNFIHVCILYNIFYILYIDIKNIYMHVCVCMYIFCIYGAFCKGTELPGCALTLPGSN